MTLNFLIYTEVGVASSSLVFNHTDSDGDDAGPLQKRINSKHGTHIVDYAASLGLGSLNYEVIDIDGE